MSDGSDSLCDDMDSSADGLDHTPRDEATDGPLPEGHPGFRPAGPPPPRPVCGPDPNDNQPRREEDGDESNANRSATVPARHTPARRPPPPESSSSSSSDTDDADRTQRRLKRSMHTTMMDGGRTHPSSWREQSWTRPGTTLSISSVASCGRTNLTSVTGQSLVKLARYGAAWRRLPGLIFKDWRHSASWASFLREWTTFEFRATHQYHPGRARAAAS